MIAGRPFAITLLSLVSAGAIAGVAQDRQPEPRRRVVVRSGDSTMVRQMVPLLRRARLGVTVDLQASANDSAGATIELVTPGGPAAKAGIKSGDVITKLNGKLLAAEGRKSNRDESLPGLRLIEIASELPANETVTLEYRRDGAAHSTTLVTGDDPIAIFDMPDVQARLAIPRMEFERAPGGFAFGTGPGNFVFEMGGPLGDLQLAPLNPDLGQYFGTSEGVLVINVPKESTLGVKPGDVILTVDGRKVSGPSSLLRVLRSYDPGDTFKLEIMRNKSRTSVSGQIEKRRER